jgi:hypothetical protein
LSKARARTSGRSTSMINKADPVMVMAME